MGVSQHARNMDDETLLALRDNGGVVQIVAFDPYVRFQPAEQLAASRELRERVDLTAGADPASLPPEQQVAYEQGLRALRERWPAATVRDFVDHIDYAVQLVGIDHVGISSDFGGGGGVVGWNDAAETMNVTTELRARGYDDASIRQIWSGNLLRVWRDVERVGAELAPARQQ
jgi:membrane dipeptidase